jgi:hypothetical protein
MGPQLDLVAYELPYSATPGMAIYIEFSVDCRDHLYNDCEGWYVDDMALV